MWRSSSAAWNLFCPLVSTILCFWSLPKVDEHRNKWEHRLIGKLRALSFNSFCTTTLGTPTTQGCINPPIDLTFQLYLNCQQMTTLNSNKIMWFNVCVVMFWKAWSNETNRSSSSARSGDEIQLFSNWTPSSPWLQLEILSINEQTDLVRVSPARVQHVSQAPVHKWTCLWWMFGGTIGLFSN